MGSPFWINAGRNPNENFTIRLINDGLGNFSTINHSAIGRELEEIMLWQDSLFTLFEMIVPVRYLYNDIDPGDGGWTETPDVLNPGTTVWRKVFTPSTALNSLVGFDALIVNYINDIALHWFREPINNNTNNMGLLVRFSNGKAFGIQTVAGFNMNLVSNEFSLISLQNAIDNLDFDEVLNALRVKLTILFAESNKYKIYNILGSIYPLDTGVGNRLLGPENLLCEDYWRDENGNMLSGCTAVGKGTDGENIFVAFGSQIRKYGTSGQPVQHANGSFVLTAIGSGDITAIVFQRPNITYIKSGLYYKIAPDEANNFEIVIQTTDFDSPLPQTKTKITGFEDIAVPLNSDPTDPGYLKKGSQIFRTGSSNNLLQTDLQVWNIGDGGDKMCMLPMLSPLKRYSIPFQPDIQPFNSDFRNINMFIVNSGGTGQVKGLHKVNFVVGFINLLSTGIEATGGIPPRPFIDGGIGVRSIQRISVESIIQETEFKNPFFSVSASFVRAFPSGLSGMNVTCHIYTGTWPVIPIFGDTANYNARGTLIGSVETETMSAGIDQSTFHIFGDTDEWRADGFLYVIFSATLAEQPSFGDYTVGMIISLKGNAP